jgi:hypothetical protein
MQVGGCAVSPAGRQSALQVSMHLDGALFADLLDGQTCLLLLGAACWQLHIAMRKESKLL